MARKRMIDPDIWEDDGFGRLSVLAKVVWFGLISHADDEGKGNADPAFICRYYFPYDETVRATDIEKALMEISTKMSIVIYVAAGDKKFYKLTKWLDYQAIQKPKISKIPDPLQRGKGGDISSDVKIQDEYSIDTVQVHDQYRQEKKGKERKGIEVSGAGAPAREDTHTDKPTLSEIESYIKEKVYNFTAKRFLSYYDARGWDNIRNWRAAADSWAEKPETAKTPKKDDYLKHEYTQEQLDSVIQRFDAVDMPWDEEEVVDFAKTSGIDQIAALEFYNFYSSKDWKGVTDWRQAVKEYAGGKNG